MCSSWLGKEGREIAAQSRDQISVLDEKGLLGGSAEVQDCSQEVKSGNISRTSQCSLSGLWVLILWTWLFINTFYLVFGNFILVCDVSCIFHSCLPLPEAYKHTLLQITHWIHLAPPCTRILLSPGSCPIRGHSPEGSYFPFLSCHPLPIVRRGVLWVIPTRAWMLISSTLCRWPQLWWADEFNPSHVLKKAVHRLF